jgi:4-hydroxybenzoate polyprenyltransferase
MKLPPFIGELLKAVVYGNIWVALCAVSMYACTVLLHHLAWNSLLAGSIFGATIFIYNYHRLFRKEKIYQAYVSERHQWILMHHAKLQGLAVFGFLLAAGCFLPFLNKTLIIRLSPFLILALFYVIPVWKRGNKWLRVRDIPYFKIFLVAAVWSFVTVVLAFLADDPLWLPDVGAWISIVSRFVFIFAITLPFDIRDLEHDRSNGLITFAGTLGVPLVNRISAFLLTLVALLAVFSAMGGYYVYPAAGGMILSCLFTGALALNIDEQSSEWMYAGFLDGTMIDQLVWIALFSNVFSG